MSLTLAKWINKGNTLQDDSGALQLLMDGAGALESTAAGVRVKATGITDAMLVETFIKANGTSTMSADLPMNNFTLTGLGDGNADSDSCTYGQLQTVASQGKVWKEALLVGDQLVNGASGGIYGAQVVKLVNNLVPNDTITLNDGSNVETYTIVASGASHPEVNVGADINATLANLETAIDAGTVAASAVRSDLNSIDGTNHVLVVWADVIGEEIRLYSTTATTGDVTIAPTTLTNLYEAVSGDMVTAPTTDPTSTNFGFSRAKAIVVTNETHITRASDSTYTWDSDGETWQQTGAASIPLASESVFGKVRIADGNINVTSGVIDLDSNPIVDSVKLNDDNDSHQLSMIWNESEETADRTLNLLVAGGNRTVTLNENLTIGDGTDVAITSSLAGGATITLAENFTIGDGTDITLTGSGAARTITLAEDLTLSGGQAVTIASTGQANTISLAESFTIAAGESVSITAEDAATAIVLDNVNFEVENTNATQRDVKLVVGTDANATLTIEGAAGVINQDVSSDASPTFNIVNGTTFDTNVAAAAVTLTATTLAADGTDDNISITLTPKGTGTLVLNGGVSGSAVLDDDTMATATDTTLATSESIKAYVDAQATYETETYTLAGGDITAKYKDLVAVPSTPGDVVMLVTGAPAQFYGSDYNVITDGSLVRRLSWNGLALDGVLAAADTITVVFPV